MAALLNLAPRWGSRLASGTVTYCCLWHPSEEFRGAPGPALVRSLADSTALRKSMDACSSTLFTMTPRLQHVYDRFGTARVFLQAAAKLTGKKW